MKTSLNDVVHYKLQNDEINIDFNQLIGKYITITFLNRISCIDCGTETPKSYANGFCYDCFSESPQNSECIIHPELCRGHLGIGRDPKWEERYHNQPHIVYLSYTGDPKVGVTSEHQIPTRWIDQGALKAMIFARTPYRQLAGEIEVMCKDFIADKTNWSKMLKTHDTQFDLKSVYHDLGEVLSRNYEDYLTNEEVYSITYPVEKSFSAYRNVSFGSGNIIEGVLHGIKAQYLILDNGQAFNMRKHAGFYVSLKVKENPVLSLF